MGVPIGQGSEEEGGVDNRWRRTRNEDIIHEEKASGEAKSMTYFSADSSSQPF